MNTSLNFEALYDTCLTVLNENSLIYLATADNDRVRSRVVDYANNGLHIGFITWCNTEKKEDITHHPQVSLSVNNLQIEGIAKVIGPPQLSEHKTFMELYRARNPNPYHNFIAMNDVALIMVESTLAIVMTYKEGYLYLDHLDIIKHRAFRKQLSPWKPDVS
jgi:general stress protein 26